ncbi:MAG: hypothetical protein ACOH2J_02900 [Allorhizobium sp.]
MHRFANSFALVMLAVLLDLTVASAAEPVPVVTPVFSQLVSYTLPEGFVPAYEDASDSAYIHEAVLNGETVDDWTQIITLTGIKDAAASDQPLETAAQNTLSRYRDACPDTLTAQSFGPSTIDGRDSLTVFLGCGTIDTAGGGQISEMSVVSFIKGKADVYTLQWAEHSTATPTAPPYDQAKWTERMQKLSPIHICDRVEGEAAPYPSCIGRD